jgi:nicotinamide-nucleotide amidase
MRCEVIAIGTELLLGHIVDTNSAWIGEQLASAGIDCYFQIKVGDNAERIEGSIRHALARSEAVICCGGLGPTQDDITRDVIARIMGVEMRRDAAIADKIRAMFEARGRAMSANNLRQADVPVGASPIPEMPGTAPGLVCPVGSKVVYALPGVPSEMLAMMRATVLPDLRRRSGQTAVIRSRVLRTWGMSESGLAEVLAPRVEELDRIGTPTIAYQASGIEGIKVRVVAKCEDDATATCVLDAEEKLIRGLLGEVVFGVDDQSMELVVLEALRRRGMTLAVAETFTGGLLAARLSAADSAMETFRGGRIGSQTSAGPEAAASAATAVCAEFGAAAGIAAIAGTPAAPSAVPVALAVAIQGAPILQTVVLPGDRQRLRDFTVISLLDLLRRKLGPWPSAQARDRVPVVSRAERRGRAPLE